MSLLQILNILYNIYNRFKFHVSLLCTAARNRIFILEKICCFFRLNKHVRSAVWSLGSITVTFVISLTKTRSNTTASPAEYAGLHYIYIHSVNTCFCASWLATLFILSFIYSFFLLSKCAHYQFLILRIGPREKYFHCKKCNLCLATDLKDNHKVRNILMHSCLIRSWALKQHHDTVFISE